MSGVFPLGVEPMAASFPPAPEGSVFFRLVQESSDSGQYLLEIVAYRGGENRSGGLWTLTEGPLAAVAGGVGATAGQVTLRYADRHWMGDPSDADQANVFYEGRVTAPIRIDRAMPILPEQPRRVVRQFGVTEIANGDGALDAIARSYAIDGRQIRVLFGPFMGAYSDFKVIADVVGVAWEADDLAVRINLRDRTYSLDTPLQNTLYTGAGGAEGTEDVEGKPKPLLHGRCRNISPTLVDPTNLIYQVHDGEVEAVDDVFDRGAALTDSGIDVATYAALSAASVPAGNFATALAVGMFKLGSSPDGLITADVRGNSDPDYQNTVDVIATRLILNQAAIPAQFVDAPSFADIGGIAGEVGIYVSSLETPTTAEVLSALIGAVGGWWGTGRDGRIKAGRLIDPSTRKAIYNLNQFSILSVTPEAAPVPRWRQRVAYQRNWTPQGEDLAASVTAARRQFLTEPSRVVSAASGTTKVRHVQALDPDPLPSLYEGSADAQTLADDLLALHSPDRRMFSVAVKRLGYLFNLGDVVRVEWPRLMLANGQNFVVVGISDDATSETTRLLVWG